MALYAFDGTGNEDKEEDGQDSNVLKFCEVYQGHSIYLPGVGTRLGPVGKFFGGIFGAGGRTRIDEMCDALIQQYVSGDKTVDVIGFSRGAALAVHFCNQLASEGITLPDNQVVKPEIRFLGVWDIVGSFGLATDTVIDFQEINVGWDIDSVPSNVDHCYHAMAIDERRETFGITRLNPDKTAGHVTEMWFRGVHSDIGGGNENPARSNIALNWMIEQSKNHGLDFDQNILSRPKYSQINRKAKISENKDPKKDPRRTVHDSDLIHESAQETELAINESASCSVDSKLKYNWSGIRVIKGGKYRFHADSNQQWTDKNISCNAEGWESEQLPWYKQGVVEFLEKHRRIADANWFALCGTVGDEEDALFHVGTDAEFTASEDGSLYLFANDLSKKYDNNEGAIVVEVTRLG